MPFVLGIEGNMKTGKTTLAKGLSKKYNAPIIECGVLYRIIASLLLKKGMTDEQIKNIVDNTKLESIMEDLKLSYNYSLKSFVPVPEDIYSAEVSKMSSTIGAITGDRWYYLFQKIIGKIKEINNIIIVGRNLLRTFPNLNVHIFLTANTQKIVKLTLAEQKNLSCEEVLQLVREREEKERIIRKFSVQDERTILIDVSDKNEVEVLDAVSNEIEKRLNV